MKKYRHRIADALLERTLQGKGAVLIEGPKWCGKTTTGKQHAQSMLDLGDVNVLRSSKLIADINSRSLLKGAVPRLIDEWQTLPEIWDTIRTEVDQRGEPSQFILTGSTVPPQTNDIIHSGTGRIARMRMRPMSLFESGESNGAVSLAELFEGHTFEPIHCADTNDLEQVAWLTCRGGWPQTIDLTGDVALDQAFDYFDAIAQSDIQRLDGVNRQPERARMLMRSYARNLAGQASFNTMRTDMLNNDSQTLSEDTIADYVTALKKLFVIEDAEAWNPNLRSKSAIRTTPTRYFVDPSIATAALGIGPNDLMNDLTTFGLIFESMAVRDLRVYADALFGKLFHYRDSSGLECDTVLHKRNGQYALIEVKLGGPTKIEEGAESLKKLANTIDQTRMKAPSFLMVLTAVAPFAYQRNDGVFVVPITALRP